MIPFHCIAQGSCWAGIVGEPPVRLEEGDVILFPHGDAQVISSAPGLRGRQEDCAIYFAPRPPQLPFSISIGGEGGTTARLEGGGREHTTIACGFLAFDARPFNPLLAALPRLLRIPGLASGRATWIGHVLDTAVDESNHRRPGGEAVLERMSEMMFVEVLRRYLDGLPPGADRLAGRDARPRRRPRTVLDAPAARGGLDARAAGRGVRPVALGPVRTLRPIPRPAADAVPRAVAYAARPRAGCATRTPRSSISHWTWATKARRPSLVRSSEWWG